MAFIKSVGDREIEKEILEAKPLLLYVTSPECIICKVVYEKIKEVALAYRDRVKFFSLDVNQTNFWKKYSILTVPSLLYFTQGLPVFKQDVFPEKKEIEKNLDLILSKKINSRIKIIKGIKKAMEAELCIEQFYNYISEESKNGKVKREFVKMANESKEHFLLLKKALISFTGEEVEPFIPQAKLKSFSLLGAIKKAQRIENKAAKFYKRMGSIFTRVDKKLKPIFRTLSEGEKKHFKVLRREEEFVKLKGTSELIELANLRFRDYF